ncbi:hypothetical protein CRUP_037417 [Coryphaenoides rupestris]|nr:hypothetical protein CRUP_037417 [Coryphaenoides rupestris]
MAEGRACLLPRRRRPGESQEDQEACSQGAEEGRDRVSPRDDRRRRGCFQRAQRDLRAGAQESPGGRKATTWRKNNSRVNTAIKGLVDKETLVQTKGVGASGSFKLNKEAKAKKPVAKKTAAAKKKPAVKKPVAAKVHPKESEETRSQEGACRQEKPPRRRRRSPSRPRR